MDCLQLSSCLHPCWNSPSFGRRQHIPSMALSSLWTTLNMVCSEVSKCSGNGFFNAHACSTVLSGLVYRLMVARQPPSRRNRSARYYGICFAGNRPHPSSTTPPFAEGDPRGALAMKMCDPRIHFALVCGAKVRIDALFQGSCEGVCEGLYKFAN